MKAIEGITGMARPAEHIAGPTGCWVHYDIVQNPEDENGNITWTYDGIWFDSGEHEQVQAGNVPGGEPWTEPLHKIFRNAQHRRTDDLYNVAYRNKRTADELSVALWSAYITALDQWNEAVSALASTFSTEVPDLPAMP